MSYDNTNRFTLGKNTQKQSDKSPDYTGKIDIDGTGYYLNAWLQTNKNSGEKFFSGSVKAVQERIDEAKEAVNKPADFDDTDIPF